MNVFLYRDKYYGRNYLKFGILSFSIFFNDNYVAHEENREKLETALLKCEIFSTRLFYHFHLGCALHLE